MAIVEGAPANVTTALRQPTPAINWRRDIEILRDLSVTVPRNHLAAAEAYWDKIAEAPQRDNPPLEQKILMARLAAETMSATENLGALVWAIANRKKHGGVARAYLAYQNRELWEPLRLLTSGTDLSTLLDLPSRAELEPALTADDLAAYDTAVAQLQDGLRTAAGNYLAHNGVFVRTYNKIKHGFVVIARMDQLIEGKQPPTDWQNDVNVLLDIEDSGNIRYIGIERTQGSMENNMAVIKMCGTCWAELASLVIWLWERGVPL